MLDAALEAALNEQMNVEFASAHIYLAMAAHLDRMNMTGAATWMRLQAREENGHAMRFFDHILDRGGRVRVGAIEAPPLDFGSALETFEAALQHERMVTSRIHALAEASDRATQVFIDWFVAEQVEEERTVERIIGSLRLAGEDGSALLMLDRELGTRSVGIAAPEA
jgi:ferritin